MSEPKSAQHSAAAYARWAGKDPDERAAHARMMSEKAAAKRAAERAAREAAGEPLPKRKRDTRRDDPAPRTEEVRELERQIAAQRERDGRPPLSELQLEREAKLHLRRAIAQATHEAMKARRDRGVE